MGPLGAGGKSFSRFYSVPRWCSVWRHLTEPGNYRRTAVPVVVVSRELYRAVGWTTCVYLRGFQYIGLDNVSVDGIAGNTVPEPAPTLLSSRECDCLLPP